MNPATIAMIIKLLATLAPYLTQLGMLTKARHRPVRESRRESDLRLAEEARRAAFYGLAGDAGAECRRRAFARG